MKVATGSAFRNLGLFNLPAIPLGLTYIQTRRMSNSPKDRAIQVRSIAEELDAHRKRQQAKHPDLTLTDMYNVLEKLRAIDLGQLSPAAISPKDKKIHDHALLSILKQPCSDLDAAVFAAYDFPTDLTDDQLLTRLVKLNHQRAAEEKQGLIRYLRPDFQNP